MSDNHSTFAPKTNAITTNESNTPNPTNSQKTKRIFLLFVVPTVVLLAIGIFYLMGGRYVSTDNAYVKEDKIPISAEVAGAVETVYVQENQVVKVGQPLFKLKANNFENNLAKAQAALLQAQTDIATKQVARAQMVTQIKQANVALNLAQINSKRLYTLLQSHAVSQAEYDQAKADFAAKTDQVKVLEQSLQQMDVFLNAGTNPQQNHPNVLAAKASFAQAQLDFGRTSVVAPANGMVSKPPKVGQYVVAGLTAMTMMAGPAPWIEANFTEKDLTYVHAGQPVKIELDLYPDLKLTGVVESLSPATGSEFSIIPAQNATGNWVKVAQRIPVRIKINSNANMPALQSGLSAYVKIDTGHKRRLFGHSL